MAKHAYLFKKIHGVITNEKKKDNDKPQQCFEACFVRNTVLWISFARLKSILVKELKTHS